MWRIWLLQALLRGQNLCLSFLRYLVYKGRPADFQPRKICIYRIGNVGDLLCTIPALWQIRRRYPQAALTLLSSPGQKGGMSANQVLAGFGCLDDIQLYYPEDLRGWTNFQIFRKRLRAMQFDYFIQIPAAGAHFLRQLRNLVFFRFAGFQRAEGFYLSSSDYFLRAQLQYMHYPYEVERCVRGLPFAADEKIEFRFVPEKKEEELVLQVLQRKIAQGRRPLLAISFSGKKSVQKWPLDRFSAIAERWVTEREGIVAVIGGNAEREGAEQIRQQMSAESQSFLVNLCGEFSIRESMVFLQHCRLLLSIDTGTAHMSSVTGTPCIDLCSAYNLPGQWFAYGERVKILRRDLPCSPCGLVKCPRAEYAECMQAITVDEVWQQMMEL